MNISIATLILSVLSAYVLAIVLGFGIVGVWWAYPIANIVGAIAAFFYLKKQDWEKNILV
jgi:Na+-driven multidrug efflux pump